MAAEFFVPWPSRVLSPNARAHWSAVAKAKRTARLLSFTLAREAGLHLIGWPADGELVVWITGYAADRRRRDADNLLASLKGHLDGLADALKVDDSRFVPKPYIGGETRKPAAVRICVTVGPEVSHG